MKVNELIELLSKQNQEAEIEIREMTNKGWQSKSTKPIRNTKLWEYINSNQQLVLSIKMITD